MNFDTYKTECEVIKHSKKMKSGNHEQLRSQGDKTGGGGQNEHQRHEIPRRVSRGMLPTECFMLRVSKTQWA